MPKKDQLLVAVINSSEEIVQIIREVLEDEGFLTVSGHIADFRSGKAQLDAYLRAHDPDVVVWDIAPPYDDNWRFFETVRTLEAMQGRKIVLTTTNLARLEDAVGPRDLIEIVGKPFDAQQIIAAICRSMPGHAPCDQPPG